MLAARSLAFLSLAAVITASFSLPHRSRRQLVEENSIQPIEGVEVAEGEEQTRDKRKLEGITQAKFGIKNAVLGFVFGKINSLIDAKTKFIDTLDKQNIEKNKQYGIESPQNGLASLSGIVGQGLQALGPKIQAVTGLLGGASGGSSGSGGSGGEGGGSGIGSLISLFTSLSGSSSGGGAAAGATIETVDSDEDDS